MSFTSYGFVPFVGGVFVLYYVLPRRAQPYLLLAASLAFYVMAAGWLCLAFLLVTTVFAYGCGIALMRQDEAHKLYLYCHKAELDADKEAKQIERARNTKKRRGILAVGLVPALGLLAVLKYSNFIIFNINAVAHASIRFLDIALPLGISFYTFMAVSYMIDVYHKSVGAERNPLKLALYVSFFPSVSQGPLSRYGQLAETLYAGHDFCFKTFARGMQRVLWGYAKKLVVADRIAVAVNHITGDSTLRGAYALITMFVYAIELYADFSGGIDITIGIAEALGITLPENFDRPLFSKSLKEYWRRWHMTMGAWFRDYVFFPVSGSKLLRKIATKLKEHKHPGAARRIPVIIATVVTWLATGIWHGAAWCYVMWGVCTCVILVISEQLEPVYARFHKRFPKLSSHLWYRALCVVRTFIITSALLMFFSYQSVNAVFHQIASIFTASNWNVMWDGSLMGLGLDGADIVIVIAGVVVMWIVSMVQRRGPVRDRLQNIPWIARYVLYVALLAAVVFFGSYGIGYNQAAFIYNQF